MRKSKIYTSAMFLLAVCIIFGGWFMTVKLLRQREEKFLGSTGRIEVQSAETALFADSEQDVQAEEAAEQEEFHGQIMSEYTRALVLAVWEYGGNEVPHEPFYGQMNMELAIDAGKKWIENMAAQGVFTDELQEGEYDMVKASLFTLDTPLIVGDLDRSMYSYWKVQFIKSDATVELTIHADSGEVWMANISVDEGNGVMEVYDLAYLLEYAFPFMETGTALWVDTRDGTVSESSLNEEVIASGRQYLVQVNEDSRVVIEFELKKKE